MSRRSLAVLVALVASVTVPASAAAHEHAAHEHAAHERVRAAGEDRLVITVSGTESSDGTFELTCAPTGGDHPKPAESCAALRDVETPFAPVAEGTQCTFLYGGAATARVEGRWQGESVDAEFTRANGCEITRWDRLVPALPSLATGAA
ncbi:SSI family serine proteinase inhibitor [Streptomyces profundus]|uniref:SSI family serine proteinase inhibitor n=1 Tax=Streptomyces profundus TaxID=2867410 RepID=UPI001D16767D|nr:SSI family serine proteinase inhibitor [Streptomyces sp. MA3_2.13]UED85215.1 subtilase-type protease inhibitor [Streptomyces sp. MA3_2.13]